MNIAINVAIDVAMNVARNIVMNLHVAIIERFKVKLNWEGASKCVQIPLFRRLERPD